MINKKSQSWSIDISLAVLVFIGAFFVFYALLNANPNTKVTNLKKEASAIVKEIASDDAALRIIDGNELNESKSGQLKNLTYEELKRRLRVAGDFCIFLEDDKGNIVLINNTYKGIGSPNIYLNGTHCNQ